MEKHWLHRDLLFFHLRICTAGNKRRLPDRRGGTLTCGNPPACPKRGQNKKWRRLHAGYDFSFFARQPRIPAASPSSPSSRCAFWGVRRSHPLAHSRSYKRRNTGANPPCQVYRRIYRGIAQRRATLRLAPCQFKATTQPLLVRWEVPTKPLRKHRPGESTSTTLPWGKESREGLPF